MSIIDEIADDRLREAAHILERENARLLRMVTELRGRVDELEGNKHVQLELRITELEQRLSSQLRLLYGPKTERRATVQQISEESAARPANGHGPDPQAKLPRIEVVHHLDEADTTCPSCGGSLVPWEGQTEDYEEVETLTRQFVMVRHRRKKYRCACGGCVETAPGPDRLVPGGRYSNRFAVEVAVGKYADHLPLERQATMMKREGLRVSSQTLWDQIEALASKLRPAYDRLLGYVRRQPVLGADETPWRMLVKRKGQNKRWYAWALAAPGAVVYQISFSRSAEAGAALIGNYSGTLVCDGYSAYESIKKQGAAFRIAHCWAHVRRKFFELEPIHPDPCSEVLELIGKLYEVERHVRDGPAEERLQARSERSRPLVEQIHDWALRQTALPGSPLSKAIDYLGNLWPGLTVFLKDPAVTLDNNAVERALRGVVVGRKNHYGSKSRRGTEVAALFYSLVESAKLAGISPADYLSVALDAALSGETIPLPHEIPTTT